MNEIVNPKTVHKPLGAYSHSVKVPKDAEWLVVAGQVGIDAKGKMQPTIAKQAEQTFRNILACLRANGMNKSHLVRLQVFLTDPRSIDAYRAARKKVLGDDVRPPSTLLIVDGLASPDLLIEVEAMAAKA